MSIRARPLRPLSTSRPPSRRSTRAGWTPARSRADRGRLDRATAATRRRSSIVMPPPNVTAVLHMGHGLNNTVQDVLVRWRADARRRGALGARHRPRRHRDAERGREAARQGRQDPLRPRARGVRRSALREFVDETGGAILAAAARPSARRRDWSRTAYTLAPELSRAVREAFVRLYERGLIYRGHRVIHWCPRCLTSLSDEEAESTTTTGKLYHIALSAWPAIRSRVASRSPRRVRRRCWATSPWRCIPTTSATATCRHARSCCRSSDIDDSRSSPTTYADPAVRHGRGEDHAGARRERLRGRAAARAADAGRDRRRRRRCARSTTPPAACPPSFAGLDRFEARETIVELLRGSRPRW